MLPEKSLKFPRRQKKTVRMSQIARVQFGDDGVLPYRRENTMKRIFFRIEKIDVQAGRDPQAEFFRLPQNIPLLIYAAARVREQKPEIAPVNAGNETRCKPGILGEDVKP